MSNSGIERFLDRLTVAPARQIVLLSIGLIACIASLDWYLGEAVSLGALYVAPVIILSGVLSRLQLSLATLLCVALRVWFNPPMSVAEGVLNGAFALLAYGLLGLFTSALMTNRRDIRRHLVEIQRQSARRIQAEQQLRMLVDSSPAAIFTLDQGGKVLSANKATLELLGIGTGGSLLGVSLAENLPVLAEALKFDTGETGFRTVAQVQGRRHDGSPFLAQACFSTYKSEGATRLAAIAFDSTEDTREREEQSQHQLHESNRIIAGAVAHEVRNVCAAMSVVYSNLKSVQGLTDNRDFTALGGLISGLGKLARLELQGVEESRGSSSDIGDVLNQLRILVEPEWQDEEAPIDWPELSQPLLAGADSFTLLQAFLNIVNNSLSAVAGGRVKLLTISVEAWERTVHIVFSDTGSGVSEPETLFQPFRSGASKIGLGLYISRALLRKHGGDLRHEPTQTGARFVVEIPLHGASLNNVVNSNKRDPAFAGR